MPILFSRCWLSAALAVAGCAPQAPIGRPQVSLPPRFESVEASVASPELDRWWEGLGDRQLTDLIETALAGATDARLAHARIREARALRAQARATTLPTGNLVANAAAQRTEQLAGNISPTPNAPAVTGQGWTEAYQLAFTPSWEVDLFGRLDAIRDRADLDERAAAFDYFAARMALAADVATGLFQARGLAAQQEDAAEALRIARDLAASAQLGVQRGLIAGADAARLDSDVANAEAEVARLAAATRIAKRSLLVLSGRPFVPTDALAITPLLPPPPALGETVPSVLLARRPDVLAAGARLASAARAIDIDRLALFPRVNFQPGATLTRTTGLFGGTSVLWSLASGIGLPVLDRARLIDQLRVTQARGEQAVITYEQAVQSAFGEAENTLTQLAADRLRLDELARATDRARYAFDAARTGYRIGLTDLTTLIQSQRTWLQTRSALRQLQSAALGDYVAAVRALGGGWSPQAVARSAGQPDVLLPDLR